MIPKLDRKKNDNMYHNNICNFNVYDIMMYLRMLCTLNSLFAVLINAFVNESMKIAEATDLGINLEENKVLKAY